MGKSKTLDKITEVASNKWTITSIVGAVVTLLSVYMPDIISLAKESREDASLNVEHRNIIDSARIYVNEFKLSQMNQNELIKSNTNTIAYLIDKIDNVNEVLLIKISEVDERDLEKGNVLLEELDPKDLHGARLYQTNPGNLYYSLDGHFKSVILDNQKKLFYYIEGNKRIYLP